jgi:Fungal specific transcription factor domain
VQTYRYSDLLNRHIVKSHSTSKRNLGLSHSASFLKPEPKRGIGNNVEGDGDAKPDRECRQLALRRLGDSMLISLGAELAQASNRRLLEQLYFRELHPHWPILHQNTFQSKTQPEELVQAVLVAGLWMTDTAKTRQLAECHHDRMVEIQCNNSVKQFLPIFSDYHGPRN